MLTNFTYRAVGIALSEGHVLLHRAEGDPFWALPGGHVEAYEPAAATLRREFLEETGRAVQVGRLVWVAENFFTHQGRRHHELGLYFLVDFASYPGGLQPFDGLEVFEPALGERLRLEFRWFPCQPEVLKALPVVPAFLQEGLADLPPSTCHVVQNEI